MELAAREAGAIMLRNKPGNRRSKMKTSKRDFVTVADIKSQNIITAHLQKEFPHIVLLSEELTPQQQKKVFDADFTGFVVDPIDGTYNFKRDMSESAVSVAYVESGEPVAGVVFDPYKNEMYTAIKGRGAMRNGERVRVSGQTDMRGASVTTSNSYDDKAMAQNLLRHLAIYNSTGVMPWTNCTGSGVLILTYLACGRMDIYHHNGLKPWDNAATFLLIREAGGKVLTLKGEEARFTTNNVLAGTPVLVDQLAKVFSSFDEALLN